MVVMQSEKVDGDKYLMSMQSEDKQGVTSPDGTLRVKVRLLDFLFMSPPWKGREKYCFFPCFRPSVCLSLCPSQNRVLSIT